MMNKYTIIKYFIFFLFFGLFGFKAMAQELENSTIVPYKDYIQMVLKNNDAYQGNRLESEIAREEVGISKKRPDPELELLYRENTEDHLRQGPGVEGEISWDIEFGGKRKSRIQYAAKGLELAEMELQDYEHNLRLEASLIYLETIKEQKLYEVQKASYESMKQIAKSDSIQHALGILTRVEALQSSVEAIMARNEMRQARTDWQNTILQLQDVAGVNREDQTILPDTSAKLIMRALTLNELELSAIENKATLKAAELNKEQTEAEENLIRAERRMDVNLIAGFEYNKASVTPSLDAPMDKVLLVGFGIPLKFSNFNKAELRQVKLAKEQSVWEVSSTKRATLTAVREAHNKYIAAEQQLNSLEEDLLEGAETILNGVIYAYQRGSTSFLEVLNARNSYNEIQTLYYESLFEYAAAYLELQYAAGIWEVEL